MKKAFALFFALSMALTLASSALAAGVNTVSSGTVNVSYVEHTGADGSNLGTDRTNSASILSPDAYDVSFSPDLFHLSLDGHINGVPFAVSGNIVTTNENRNLLLLEADDSSGNYEAAYVSVERELEETPLFFADFHQNNPEYQNVIKLYMRPVNTDSFVQVEIFFEEDFVASFLEAQPIPYDCEKADTIQCWFAEYFEPVAAASDEPVPISSNAVRRDFSRSYNINGINVRIHFVVDLVYELPNMAIGGATHALMYFRVVESSMTSTSSAYNSSTQNYLLLRNLNIKLSSMPNVVFTAQSPYRSGIQDSIGSVKIDFSASFGISIGGFSAYGSLSFNDEMAMSTADVVLFVDNVSGIGVKGTECGMLPSNYYLNKAGSNYGFEVRMLDKKETGSYSGTMRVTFDLYLENSYSYTEDYNGTFPYSVTVRVG